MQTIDKSNLHEEKPKIKLSDSMKTSWRHIDYSWKFSTLIFLVVRMWLTFIGSLVFINNWFPRLCEIGACNFYWSMTPVLTGWRGAFLGMWQRLDTLHYQSIAMTGYALPENTAFFPGYPLLAHGIAYVLHISDLAGLLLVSNIFCWLSFVLLFRLVREMSDESTAKRAVVFLAVFPSSFFLFGGYPQSIVLFLTLFCYWQAKHNRWLLAELSALFAGLIHGTVIPLCLMLAWQVFDHLRINKSKLRWSTLAVPLLPLGGIALFFSWRILQGFPSISSILQQYYQRQADFPWNTVIDAFKMLAKPQLRLAQIVNLVVLFFMAFVVVWSMFRLPVELKIYSCVLLLFLLSTKTSIDPLGSLNRYALILFPAFIMLAKLSNRKFVRFALIIFSAVLLSLLSFYFFIWGWIG